MHALLAVYSKSSGANLKHNFARNDASSAIKFSKKCQHDRSKFNC